MGVKGAKPESRPLRIDLGKASVQAVRLRAASSEVRAVFGAPHPFSRAALLTPLGETTSSAALPGVIAPPGKGESFEEMLHGVMRYRGIVFGTSQRAGVYYFAVTAGGSRVFDGPEIGDPLRIAERSFGRPRCGTRNKGTEYRSYPYCTARVAHEVYVWAGGDPISSLAVATRPLD